MCPRHSRGLPVQGTRKALPVWCLVINLSLSDLVTVTGETLLALLYTNITNRGEGRLYGCQCAQEMTGNGKNVVIK